MGKQVTVVKSADCALPVSSLYTVGATVILTDHEFEGLPAPYVSACLTDITTVADPDRNAVVSGSREDVWVSLEHMAAYGNPKISVPNNVMRTMTLPLTVFATGDITGASVYNYSDNDMRISFDLIVSNADGSIWAEMATPSAVTVPGQETYFAVLNSVRSHAGTDLSWNSGNNAVATAAGGVFGALLLIYTGTYA